MTPFTLSITDTGPRILDIELAHYLGVDNLRRFQRHISDHAQTLSVMGSVLEVPVASYDQREASKVHFLTVAHALCIADNPTAFGYEASSERTSSTTAALYAVNASALEAQQARLK